jgi:hypothetical protein
MGLWHLDGDRAQTRAATGTYGVVVGATVVPNGISGSAYAFDGNDRITVGDLDFSGERFTVNIWLQYRPAAKVEDWRMPINKADSSAINQTFQILLGGRAYAAGGGRQRTNDAGVEERRGPGQRRCRLELQHQCPRRLAGTMAHMTYPAANRSCTWTGCPASYGRYSGPLPLVPGEVAIGGVEGLVFHPSLDRPARRGVHLLPGAVARRRAEAVQGLSAQRRLRLGKSRGIDSGGVPQRDGVDERHRADQQGFWKLRGAGDQRGDELSTGPQRNGPIRARRAPPAPARGSKRSPAQGAMLYRVPPPCAPPSRAVP